MLLRSAVVVFLFSLSACQCARPAACGSNIDCESSHQPYCSATLGCVECLSDDQCASGLCQEGVCSVCGPKAACAQGEICADGVCAIGCSSDGAGCPNGQHCLPGSDACVQCLTDAQCGPGHLCDGHTCVTGCSPTNPACSTGQVCDADAGACVGCLGNGDCLNPNAKVCDLASHNCVACAQNSDCKDPNAPVCDTASHSCVACVPGPNDSCPAGAYCTPNRTCERGCKTGLDCPSATCLDHSCAGCTSDSQCVAGDVCSSGTCLPACGPANLCPANQACCNGLCEAVNTLQRCGACNVTCGADQFCDGTICQTPTFPNFCANTKVYVVLDAQPTDDAAAQTLASTIQANCPSTTMITVGPQTNPQWVDQTTGALLLGAGATLVTAGGPSPNKPVKWLEKTQQVTKVYFATNNVDTYYFKLRSSGAEVASMKQNTCSPHHDRFLFELATDPSSSTLALIGYGACPGGYGTTASAWYWANVVLPNKSAYPDSWYVYDWADTNSDGAPNVGDTFTKVASGN